MLLAIGIRLNRGLTHGDNYAVVRFAIFVAMVIANFAESNFAHMSALGFLFILAAIGHVRSASTQDMSFALPSETRAEEPAVSEPDDSPVPPMRSHPQ